MGAAFHIRVAHDSLVRCAETQGDAPTSDYTALIKRLAPNDVPELIEAEMRHEHGTLENIEPIRFARAVKAAAARIRAHVHRARPNAAA